MSPVAHDLLKTQGCGLFLTESRGSIDIKGKGKLEVLLITLVPSLA